MDQPLRRSEEFSAAGARLRVDVRGGPPLEHVMDDMTFLNYRLAEVRLEPAVTLPEPDVLWLHEGNKAVRLEGQRIVFTGPWPAGPIQKVVVAALASRRSSKDNHRKTTRT